MIAVSSGIQDRGRGRFSGRRKAFGRDARRSGMRRLTALACVAVLVVLQCFVVLPAVTEQVHASEEINMEAEYSDGTYVGRKVGRSFLEDLSDIQSVEIKDEEGNVAQTLEGPTLKAVLTEAGITSEAEKVEVNGTEIKWNNKDYFIDLQGDSYVLYKKTDDGAEPVGDVSQIYIKQGSSVKPVSFSKTPASNKTSPTVGDTIKIKYKLKVDKFYKNSEEYDEETATKLTWSGNSRVKLLKTTTSGTSGTIKAKIKKSGTITIEPDSEAFPKLTSGVKVSFTGQNTTTTTRATTRATFTPYRPTTRPAGGTVSRVTGTTTAPTTATRPSETDATDPTESTAAPSFQTITVKEVYLTPVTEPADPGGSGDDGWDDPEGTDGSDDDPDRDDDSGVTIPAAAGSAAVAVAACGAGAAGRVRRYRADMGEITAAAETGAAASGGKGRPGFLRGRSAGRNAAPETSPGAVQPDAGKPDAGKPDAGKTDKASAGGTDKAGRNPLKKFRRKS